MPGRISLTINHDLIQHCAQDALLQLRGRRWVVPGFVQTLAQMELWTNGKNLEKKVYLLPKHLDEEVARLHLDQLGAKLTKLTAKQAAYISVKPEGPYKPEIYRY